MRIQHNIAAMNAYRNYNTNTSAVSKNLEKLSSGYKINRAGDDAAGLAISEKMRAQISGLKAASKNVKDGISLVKTAEGAMQEVQDMLNRMVTLATQSANGTYDNAVDRANLQKEVDQLNAEINRIADSSNFNGIKLMDGSQEIKTTYKVNDVATNSVSTIAGALTIKRDGQLGVEAQAGKFVYDLSQMQLTASSGTGVQFSFTIGGPETGTGTTSATGTGNVGTAITISLPSLGTSGGTATGADFARAVAQAFKENPTISIGGVNFTVTANGSQLILEMDKAPDKKWEQDMTLRFQGKPIATSGITGNYGEQFKPTVEVEPIDSTQTRRYAEAELDLSKLFNGTINDGDTIQIGKTTYTFAVGSDSRFKNVANVVDLTDKTAASTTLAKTQLLNTAANRLTKAALNNETFFVGASSKDGVISLTEKEGAVDYSVNNLAGKNNLSVTGNWTPDDGATQKNNWKNLIKSGVTNVSGEGLTLQIGDTSEDYNQLVVSIGDIHTKALGVNNIDISTQKGAAAAIDTVKNAINTVSSIRGTLGATQNRLEHTANNLSVMTENIQDAESTIRDTDIAEEMMAYTKNNILVQSAQAMLAQANQIPQGVLQLLG